MNITKKANQNYENFINDFIQKLSFREMLHIIDSPNLTKNDLILIKEFIFKSDYPKKLKPLVIKLYNYTSLENLLFCVLNLYSVQIFRMLQYYTKNNEHFLIEGSYDANKNEIIYCHNKDIPHELLHLSSTPPTNRYHKRTGFYYFSHGKGNNRGMNEGYTELLSQRIYFNEKYNSNCYNTALYLMRLFELIYETHTQMESDYFKANYNSLINQFLNFGTKEEFCKLSNFLDQYEYMLNINDIKEVFEIMEKVIYKTEDNKKILLAKEIKEEYFKNKKFH